MPVYTYSFLGLVQQLTNLTAAPSPLIKGDLTCSCKVPVSIFFRTSPSPTALPYNECSSQNGYFRSSCWDISWNACKTLHLQINPLFTSLPDMPSQADLLWWANHQCPLWYINTSPVFNHPGLHHQPYPCQLTCMWLWGTTEQEQTYRKWPV